ncbi:hypothetical protein MANES_17G026799v8 [Manihot esculenta]|uniref:Uncharacterized protein n=5 Tax=Manihot esculenta TaxID=3983 RepID=A0ACB7G3A7_MANES|nr:hypothetical protein MANES_17G026799v8 [Manihot esculenta]KAG8634356.1 hypothetical protein MANES_17G026799v8 [Manihot esculenta]KAG8634357.1 hypothetical protein MANES_17G026799v8 [Manihot esculenta]KAG8634358.1 hypothetical protein MANES_17G026799v8 [Manihot esculenta]KAG8634359.1 hypothetical protein MANES_17G026799v8 [Manihot esculenta]
MANERKASISTTFLCKDCKILVPKLFLRISAKINLAIEIKGTDQEDFNSLALRFSILKFQCPAFFILINTQIESSRDLINELFLLSQALNLIYPPLFCCWVGGKFNALTSSRLNIPSPLTFPHLSHTHTPILNNGDLTHRTSLIHF